MSITQTENQSIQDQAEIPREDWGNGLVVISEEDETGSWIMFDPDDDEVDLTDWR